MFGYLEVLESEIDLVQESCRSHPQMRRPFPSLLAYLRNLSESESVLRSTLRVFVVATCFLLGIVDVLYDFCSFPQLRKENPRVPPVLC